MINKTLVLFMKIKFLTFWWRGRVVLLEIHLQLKRASFPRRLQAMNVQKKQLINL